MSFTCHRAEDRNRSTYKSVEVIYTAFIALTDGEMQKLQVALNKRMRKKLALNDLKNGDLLIRLLQLPGSNSASGQCASHLVLKSGALFSA